MLQPWIIVLCSLVYIGILFAIAYYGDSGNYAKKLRPYRGIIYSLSLAIYCTSWTYYGAVGSAATNGWRYIAIYLGPMLLIFFGYRFLKKVATICSEQNITSIADFISSRYGKSQQLAVLVTLIAITGTLPYIALQLKAIASSYEVLTSLPPGAIASQVLHPLSVAPDLVNIRNPWWSDTGFIVALVMAVFSILFGTRYVHASEHHEGLILAIAFESIVKLFALTLVAFLAVVVLLGATDLELSRFAQDPQAAKLSRHSLSVDMLELTFLSHTVLAMAAIFCLPRQFHVSFVEVTHPGDMRKARWVFPLYLLLTTLVVIPITLAGSLVHTQTGMNVAAIVPDMFVLTLPVIEGSDVLALLAFIGGFSAATGMVIVAVITLSTMVCNDIVMPLLFRVQSFALKQKKDLTRLLLLIRRVSIVLILILSYLYYQYIDDEKALASIGLTAFVAAIQFAPAIIGAVYWKQATRRGAIAGLLAGFGVWLYTLFIPGLLAGIGGFDGFISLGPWGIDWLRPSHLLGVNGLDAVTHSLLFSLGLNILCFLLFSFQRKPLLLERMQAANFTHTVNTGTLTQGLPWWSTAEVGELRLLAEKFVGRSATRQAFADFTEARRGELVPSEKADAELVNFTEHLLAGAIGASSARVMINSVLNKKKDLPLEDVFSIVDETSQALQFSQSLLHATIEHLDQGVSVVDEHLNLVAWNSRYLEIYNYPQGLIKVGRPVADIIRHNALAGECGPGEVDEHVEKRLNHMRVGTVHSFQRYRPDGTVLQIQGRPLPGGGFVTSFTDITEYKKVERELRDINENLEQMVGDRTLELSLVNDELKQANRSKNRFLAAVNHDVMQPLNAARLFTSALAVSPDDRHELTDRISSSLRSAEEIIQTLIAISKLDSGAVKANITTFNINKVLSTLEKEFEVIAANKQIRFKMLPCQVMVRSDAHLLRRILQNFISNALRYTPKGGRVTVGCRRIDFAGDMPQLKICTLDTGVGIAKSDQEVIFEEFRQLDNQLF
ncbi:MAG: PAS-domain containing protein, partial [Thiolinea sp.]